MVDNKEIQNIHSARGKIYAFLSNVFMQQPSEEFYNMVADAVKQFEELTSNEDIAKGVELLKTFINHRTSLKGDKSYEFELDVQRKYTYIMCLPLNAPQEESYYTSKDHLLNQESYDEMTALFKKYEIGIDENKGFSYDHIGIEFKFMSYISYMVENKILNNEDYIHLLKEQYDFHINHFDKWLIQFLSKVQTSAGKDELLFNGFCYIAKGFIYEDKLLLQQFITNS